MPRRIQLKGVCNDLLDTFVSRYNVCDGYWAMGKLQAYLQTSQVHELVFDLIDYSATDKEFPEIVSFSREAIRRQIEAKNTFKHWIRSGKIMVQSLSSYELFCEVRIATDLGREFNATRKLYATVHDPGKELRSAHT